MKLVNLSIKVFIGFALFTMIFTFSTSTENKSNLKSSVSAKASATVSATSTATVSSESEMNLNHGIFLNDRLFKYKNAKKNLSKTKSRSLNKNPPQNQNQAKKSTNQNNNQNNQGKPNGNSNGKTKTFEGPILHKSWIKYFKYSGKVGMESSHPNSFKINRQFYEQPKYFPNADLKTKKDGFYEYIRDPKYFFLHLFENMVGITSSRHVNK